VYAERFASDNADLRWLTDWVEEKSRIPSEKEGNRERKGCRGSREREREENGDIGRQRRKTEKEATRERKTEREREREQER
jgi:hypothetical protein